MKIAPVGKYKSFPYANFKAASVLQEDKNQPPSKKFKKETRRLIALIIPLFVGGCIGLKKFLNINLKIRQ